MATRESLAIREEQAQARISKASKAIAEQTGVEIPELSTTEKDPFARNAALAEQTADMLESIVKAVTPEPDPESESDEKTETDDGGDNAGASGDTAPQSPEEPIKRSTAKRKR